MSRDSTTRETVGSRLAETNKTNETCFRVNNYSRTVRTVRGRGGFFFLAKYVCRRTQTLDEQQNRKRLPKVRTRFRDFYVLRKKRHVESRDKSETNNKTISERDGHGTVSGKLYQSKSIFSFYRFDDRPSARSGSIPFIRTFLIVL